MNNLQLALKVALRQWASYYGERNHCDIESQDDNEALAYRDCASKLSSAPTERAHHDTRSPENPA